MKTIYLVFEIIEYEYLGSRVVACFTDEDDAIAMVEKNQETIEHWAGRTIKTWYYEEWELN